MLLKKSKKFSKVEIGAGIFAPSPSHPDGIGLTRTVEALRQIIAAVWTIELKTAQDASEDSSDNIQCNAVRHFAK